MGGGLKEDPTTRPREGSRDPRMEILDHRNERPSLLHQCLDHDSDVQDLLPLEQIPEPDPRELLTTPLVPRINKVSVNRKEEGGKRGNDR